MTISSTPSAAIVEDAGFESDSAARPLWAERYQLIRQIGKGGWGRLFEALDLHQQRIVVVKLLRSAHLDHARFRREARLTALVNHPNVIRVLDAFADHDQPALVLERLHGQTLRQLEVHGGWSVDRALPILVQIARGLEATHHAGIVHRDLKPSNIFITQHDGYERAKIIDFGLGKRNDDPLITADGHVVGTPAYMSPEQCLALHVDERSDIYAWGAIAYELLSGTRAVDADTDRQAVEAALHLNPVPIGARKRGIPLPLQAIVMKTLSKAPRSRFQKTESLVSALHRL